MDFNQLVNLNIVMWYMDILIWVGDLVTNVNMAESLIRHWLELMFVFCIDYKVVVDNFYCIF